MTETVFNTLYNRLNVSQKKAVDTIEGPVMVIAGPGTGKTTVLTLRIANILRKTDTPASGILAITFTEAGVKAMRMKLREVIGGRADDVRIHTFHGFAASIIAEFKDRFVHLDRVKQMTDIDAEGMMREILKDKDFADLRPFSNPDFYVGKIISAISESKREALSPEMVKDFAKAEVKRINSDEGSYSTRGKTKGELKAEAKRQVEKCERTFLFAEVYDRYEKKKRTEKKMDFDDLLVELLVALQKDELLLQMLQEKFLYILVDEHQDTNDAQNLLLRLLADFFESPNLFIVGDEKQAIYRFQGASVENFLRFKSIWKNMQVIQLENNYRSHQHILDAGFSMIEKNYAEGEHADLRIKLKSGVKFPGQPIDVIAAENVSASENYLISELKRISETEPKSTVAVITKTNRDLERVLRLAESAGVRVASERSVDIFNHPAGSLFFELLAYLGNPTETDMLGKTLAAGLWGIPFEDSVTLIKSLRSGKDSDLEKKLPQLGELRKHMTEDSPIGFLIHTAERAGYIGMIARNPGSIEVWRGIVTLAESLVREGDIHDPRELVARLLSYRSSAESRSVKVTVGTPDLAIRAMTAHGSKGLEFDYVYIPYATEESWVGRTRGTYFVLPHRRQDEDEMKDVRRLLYVALTRARKHASVLYGLEDSGGAIMTPLRFINEFEAAHVTHRSIKGEEREFVQEKHVAGNDRHEKFIAYAKASLLNNGLSVTALNNFLTCPSYFLYQSVVKLPQAPAASAEKGNAMHKAFDHVWRSKKKETKQIEKIIRSTTEEHFEDSYLPQFQKDAVKKELLHNAPIVARELTSHFKQAGTVHSESWSEIKFESSKKSGIVIPLHGKIDAIVEADQEVRVFDYKTREGMTVAAIKGEIKSSDGNYFRQLVFYKMLLSADSRFKSREIIPSLVFVSPDKKGKCPIVTIPVEQADIDKVAVEIDTLIEHVWSGKIMTDICEDQKCEWCRLKSLV
jgi:DNA helicase II / ATP-dependent DNA helicase PcrA